MKIKEDFVLRQVAGIWAVLPLGAAAVDLNGMLTLNDSGVRLWRELEQGSEREALADVLTGDYNVSRNQALADVDEFIEKLNRVGCIEA